MSGTALGPDSTSDDPTRYRPEAEVAEWARRDPLRRLETYLRRGGFDALALFEEQPRVVLGICTVSGDGQSARRRLEKAIDFIEDLHLAEVIDQEVEIL